MKPMISRTQLLRCGVLISLLATGAGCAGESRPGKEIHGSIRRVLEAHEVANVQTSALMQRAHMLSESGLGAEKQVSAMKRFIHHLHEANELLDEAGYIEPQETLVVAVADALGTGVNAFSVNSLLSSVSGDELIVALDRVSGQVVQGIEPEAAVVLVSHDMGFQVQGW